MKLFLLLSTLGVILAYEDLILTPEQEEILFSDSPQTRNVLTSASKKWPGGIVYYKFASSIPQDRRNLFKSSINSIQQSTCLRFVEGGPSIRYFVQITDNDNGCYSYLGYLKQGGQRLNLQRNGCWYKYIIIHEMLHAVGVVHQHQTPDRDKYVKILYENITPQYKYAFDKYKSSTVTDFGIGYDYYSIMHYNYADFSKNGKPTIQKVYPDGSPYFGSFNDMSQKDILKLRKMYNCK
ncbi:hypothetical protein ACFFRR_003920 [Megaselia abdita]